MTVRTDPEPAAAAPPAGRTHAFPRHRRLKRRRLIRPLFDRARPEVGRVRVGGIQLLARAVPREAVGVDAPLQVGVSPGCRRTAVVRNRLRRLLRETFRQHQGLLLERLAGRPDTLTLFVLYRGRDEAAAAAIPRDLPDALRRLADRLPAPAEAPASRNVGPAAP